MEWRSELRRASNSCWIWSSMDDFTGRVDTVMQSIRMELKKTERQKKKWQRDKTNKQTHREKKRQSHTISKQTSQKG